MATTAEELLAYIQDEFAARYRKSQPVYTILENIKKRASTYEDAAAYADEVGQICSDALRKFFSGEYLTQAELTAALANGTIPPVLADSYSLVSDVSTQIQKLLNEKAGLGLAAKRAAFDSSAAKNLAQKVADVAQTEGLERAQWVLNEPVKTFNRKVVDETIKANVDFQAKAGLRPIIRRTIVGGCCEWCAALAGQWNYGEEPKDVYRRHERCRCLVLFIPGDGRRQNVHTKAWQ